MMISLKLIIVHLFGCFVSLFFLADSVSCIISDSQEDANIDLEIYNEPRVIKIRI